jgi:cell division protein FtsL
MATADVSRNESLRPLDEADLGEEPERHLRVVPIDGRRFRLTPKTGVGLTVALFGALFGVAVSHALLIEGQLELDHLDQQVAEEQARYERLRLEVAELQSPERILTDAQELGMVPPEDVIWLTPDQPAPAAGGSASGGGAGAAGEAAAGAGDGAAASAAGGESAAAAESPGTSWVDVKPYLGTTP